MAERRAPKFSVKAVSGVTLQELIAGIDREKLADSRQSAEEAPVARLVEYIISQAVQAQASDIHIEPEEKLLNLRYRIDGMLHRQPPFPRYLVSAVSSRFKTLAGLDIAEKRLPQEGKLTLQFGGKEIDFRISTCPTVHGENIVLRILDRSGLVLDLASLGFTPKTLAIFKETLNSACGIMLVTGPTRSGKTTTLYSCLQLLNKDNVNIMTVEDPVEYQFPGIRQVNLNALAGLSFASALRTFLHQDPDIVMAGEIGDLETAEVAVQAALTGHMVFSTLHIPDSPSAFTRLMNMGVEPFLISSSVAGVLSQRLLRKVCEKCKEFYAPSAGLLRDMGLGDRSGPGLKFASGKGCKNCDHSGYKGRTGIYEFLKVSAEVQEAVLKKATAAAIREIAVKQGMVTLRQAALEKLTSGITTPEEVRRVTFDSGG